jgi:lipoprotein-anchoring transpeptidase ErfK/SrfK
MRKRMWAGVALAGMALAMSAGTRQALAEKIKISPKAFQIFGGIDDGGSSASRASYTAGDVPEDLRSRTISFASNLAPGSVVVRTGERMLYYILPGGEAIAYHVGVGREGFTWTGANSVSRKAEWPDWRPPREMIAREAKRGRKLPEVMAGGPENPLGARAIYIGDTEFRIHGTTQPWSIGKAMSSGCIRMMNEEVIDLYERVAIGATVVVED